MAARAMRVSCLQSILIVGVVLGEIGRVGSSGGSCVGEAVTVGDVFINYGKCPFPFWKSVLSERKSTVRDSGKCAQVGA